MKTPEKTKFSVLLTWYLLFIPLFLACPGAAQSSADAGKAAARQTPDKPAGPCAAIAGQIGDCDDAGRRKRFRPLPRLQALAPGTALDLGAYDCMTRQVDADRFHCLTITDYSRFNYDPYHHRLLLFGGGHAATGETSVDVLDLTSNVLRWRYLYPSMTCDEVAQGDLDPRGFHRKTGHPVARHTYDMSVIAKVKGQPHLLLLSTQGGGGHCHPYHAAIQSVARLPLQGKANHWRYGRDWGRRLPWYMAAAAEYDPVSGMVIVVGPNASAGEGGMWVYDPGADEIIAFVPMKVLGRAEGIENNLVYYPPTQSMYLFEKGKKPSHEGEPPSPVTVRQLVLNRKFWRLSTLKRIKASGAAPLQARQTGFAYNPDTGRFGGAVTDQTFYTFDPRNNRWQSFPIRLNSSVKAPLGDLAAAALDYDPVNKVYIFMATRHKGLDKRVWAYRPVQ